jgi:transposase
MAKLGRCQVKTAQQMVDRGVAVRQVARQLGVTESALRYRLKRPLDAPDGRRERRSALEGWEEVVVGILERFGDGRVVAASPARSSARLVFDVLVREYGFAGSYQAVRRHLRRRFGPEPVQAVRRVELPPGVQAQHDWFEWRGWIGGEGVSLYGLIGTLSHSRATYVWVSRTMTQLAWQTGHLELFRRYGGVPLWVRIDNLRTGVAAGAGPTAVLNPAFERFARLCGFQVDACRAGEAKDKGKVERQVRSRRGGLGDLLPVHWSTLEALQQALDRRAEEMHERRRCPATGTTVAEALAAERSVLEPLPDLREPFDLVVARRVSRDALVSFEGRRYSVPFAWLGRTVEVLGTAHHVVIQAEGREIARHPRHTACRLVIRPEHYDGASTPTVLAPPPLGHRARRQLASWPGLPQPAAVGRPLNAYLTLIEEVCR